MPTLVIRSPDGSTREHALVSELTIGRAAGNDVVLAEGGVSRRHARFFIAGDAVQVEDAGSANGTVVDGVRIEGPTVLSEKSLVVLGDYEVSVKGAKPRAGPRPTRGQSGERSTAVVALVSPSGPAALAKRTKPNKVAGPQLRGLSGPIIGKTFSLKGVMLVGRGADCDVQVDDHSVSRQHAQIEVVGQETVLRDLESANGTTVNGVPIAPDTVLVPGDIVQFGIVESIYEGVAAGSSKALARPSQSAALARRPAPRRGGWQVERMPTTRRRRLLVVGGTVVGLAFMLVGLQQYLGARSAPSPTSGRGASAKPVDPLETSLSVCREYSALDAVPGPNWAKAEAACKEALDLEPIHKEANELMKKIQLNRACDENLKVAQRLISSNRPEESLDSFLKIRPDCGYFLKALAAAKEPVEEVKKSAGVECRQYAASGKWENALKRCEVYVRLACQLMTSDERQLPSMMKVKLDGPLGRTDWRPKDPLYLNFLRAREKLTPGAPPWQCPEWVVFRPLQVGEGPSKRVKEDFVRRYPDPELGRALGLYFDGKFTEMHVPLSKLQENIEKAKVHELAKALSRDITTASNLYQTGATELNNDKPERAAEPFRGALAIDEKLMLGDAAPAFGSEEAKRQELERRKSYVRQRISDDMPNKTLEKGRGFADRHDYRAACRVWKLGMSFSKTNLDLLKALTNVCSNRASEAFKSADTCERLRAVLEYAVDGDGYKEKATAAYEDLKCQD